MLATIITPNQEFEGIVQPELGLARGSVFTNLYMPYKYNSKNVLMGNCDRQKLLAMIDIYSFLINDLTLYMDTHPNCNKYVQSLNSAKSELQKLTRYYEANFGVLSISAIGTAKTHLNGPWPWEDRF